MTAKMSGEIFHPPDSLDDLDITRWNPLTCYLCNEKYEEPCILGCFHSFCSRCLRGRDVEGKMICPLCGHSTILKDGEELPQSDRLMKFLVESTGDEKEKCANCDTEFEQMFFCNTCDQPLCESCREETHKAKMFAKHDIVVLSKRTKEIHRECAIHQEPYILFSTERKSMLCINCFRDMKVESRSYCVDLETAYNQGCKKLDQSMMAIKDLQISVRDAILLLKVLLEELDQNADKEKTEVTELYQQLLEKITETKTTLIKEVDSQFESKDKTFKAELVTLSTLLPTLHTHLVTSAAFCSSANRFEFLDLAYVLMERLKSIIQLQHPLHPSQGSQIITDYKSMFARCLEPLLFPTQTTSVITTSSAINLAGSSLSLSTPSSYSSPRLNFTSTVSANSSPTNSPQYPLRRQTGINAIKYRLIESKSAFAEHCAEFDVLHKELNSSTEKLKTEIQELQRDLTVRRCMAKMTVVSDLDIKIKSLQNGIDEHFYNTKNEQKQHILEKHWEESLQRIATEQELYQAQLHEIIRLKQESEKLQNILNRMSSFVASIASVTERIAPKLGQTYRDNEHDTQIAQLFEQINTMTPDSQHRVDAIRTAQEERETLAAGRQNPLDEELVRTKGMLKAPSARKDIGRKDSTKRNSREIKELVVESSIVDQKVVEEEDTEKLNLTGEKTNFDNKETQPENITKQKRNSGELNPSAEMCEKNGILNTDLKFSSEKNKVVKNNQISTPEKNNVNTDQNVTSEKDRVVNNVQDSIIEKNRVVNNVQDSIIEKNTVVNNVQGSIIEKNRVVNTDLDSIIEKNRVVNTDQNSIVEKNRVVKTVQNIESKTEEIKATKSDCPAEGKIKTTIEKEAILSENFSAEVEKTSSKDCKQMDLGNRIKSEKVSCDRTNTESEEFSLPKDFVASTVKGFEKTLENSPEKGDKSVVKRTRRTRKNKQSQSESQSCDCHDNSVSHDEQSPKNNTQTVDISNSDVTEL